jgi:hypothetical protein
MNNTVIDIGKFLEENSFVGIKPQKKVIKKTNKKEEYTLDDILINGNCRFCGVLLTKDNVNYYKGSK